MIQAGARRDLDNDLLVRANLDAVLRLIKPTDPANSKLLSSAIMPHKPNGRSILTGPNHPTYRQLATWLRGIKSPIDTAAKPAPAPMPSGSPGGATTAGFAVPAGPAPPRNGGFAVDRVAPDQNPTAPAATQPKPTAPVAIQATPSASAVDRAPGYNRKLWTRS